MPCLGSVGELSRLPALRTRGWTCSPLGANGATAGITGVLATRTFRVFSAHSPRNFLALKNFKKDPFFYFSNFFKILKSKKKILKIFEKNHNFKKFQFFF